jgi:hypothetical protein
MPVDRHEDTAEHDPVITVEPVADSRDELVGCPARIFPPPFGDKLTGAS